MSQSVTEGVGGLGLRGKKKQCAKEWRRRQKRPKRSNHATSRMKYDGPS